MELLKINDAPLEFKWQDVTFLIKPRANANDKLTLDLSGEMDSHGNVKINLAEGHRLLIRLFVVGWRGVTSEGKEVPYSYDTFIQQFPSDPSGDVCLMLGAFIREHTGIFATPKDDEKKKD